MQEPDMRVTSHFIIPLLLGTSCLGDPGPRPYYDDLREKVIRFEHKHDPFVRDLFGCAATGPMTEESCFAGRSTINYEKFLAARRAAAKLYSLRED